MEGNKMEKRYGLPTAIAMVIGIVIGSGVFIKGGKVLALTGGNLAQGVLVVGVVGFICIICSLVFAELGSRYEKVNGVVDYAEVALGSKYAYYVGWFMTTIYCPALAAILSYFAALFFCALCGMPGLSFSTLTLSPQIVGVAAGFLMIGYALNALSPKLAGRLQVSMTVIKLIPLILMGVVGTIVGISNGSTANVLDFVNTAAYAPIKGGFFNAVVGFAFAYEGWIMATSINAELKDAKRNLPLALIIGSVSITIIYALYIFSMSSVGSVDAILATWPLGETLPKIAFSNIFGTFVGTIIYLFCTISCLGTMNGIIMSSCRSMYALSVRNMGPRPAFYSDIDHQNNFAIKSSLIGLLLAGFWFAWDAVMWWHGPDMLGTWHNCMWLAWEPDEISIVNLYAMYIPMFIALMIKAKDLTNPVKRFVIPGLGLLCCIFMCYCCWVGKGYQQVIGYLIVLAFDFILAWIFERVRQKKVAA